MVDIGCNALHNALVEASVLQQAVVRRGGGLPEGVTLEVVLAAVNAIRRNRQEDIRSRREYRSYEVVIDTHSCDGGRKGDVRYTERSVQRPRKSTDPDWNTYDRIWECACLTCEELLWEDDSYPQKVAEAVLKMDIGIALRKLRDDAIVQKVVTEYGGLPEGVTLEILRATVDVMQELIKRSKRFSSQSKYPEFRVLVGHHILEYGGMCDGEIYYLEQSVVKRRVVFLGTWYSRECVCQCSRCGKTFPVQDFQQQIDEGTLRLYVRMALEALSRIDEEHLSRIRSEIDENANSCSSG